MAGIVGVVAVLAVAVAGLGSLYAARSQAQVAADAASLAAAVASYPPASDQRPEISAGRVARSNGAALIGCDCPRDLRFAARTVQVTTGVTLGVPVFGEVTVRASSRAEFDPGLWLGR